MNSLLSPDDLEVIHETLQEIRDMPPPRDNAPVGCLMAILGLVVLLGLPALNRVVTIGQGLGATGLLVGGGLLVLGIIVWQTAGGFVRGQYVAAGEAALRELEMWAPEGGDREVALRAATLLLTHAVASYGPTSTSSFDYAEAETRLASMMPLVLAVQDVLVEAEAAYPIFETKEGEDPDHALP